MNKLSIITGANTGLGYETAKILLQNGYDVLMANRNEKKSYKAIEKLSGKGFPGKVSFQLLDLEDRASIDAFAETFRLKYNNLDILINNAGVLLPRQSRSRNGLESHFDINYLGHFYLNNLLMKHLNADGLVVSLSSLAHKMDIADIHFNDLSFQEIEYKKMKAYAQSKLAVALYGVELARKFEGTEKRSVIVHPGVSNTDIVSRHFPKFLVGLLMPLIRLYGISGPAEGAKSIIHSVLEPDIPNGAYIGPQGRKEWRGEPGYSSLSAKALDQSLAIRLWQTSEEMLNIKFEV